MLTLQDNLVGIGTLMARPRKTHFTCPICEDVFTRDAWPFRPSSTSKGNPYEQAEPACGPCLPEFNRRRKARRKAK